MPAPGFGPDTFPSAESPLILTGPDGKGNRIASAWYRLLVNLWNRTEITRAAGEVVLWAGFANAKPVPTGWLICDGTAISRVTYSTLFACIGIAYGPGDGITTFNIPNFGAIGSAKWMIKN
jgi:hypothetical protein